MSERARRLAAFAVFVLGCCAAFGLGYRAHSGSTNDAARTTPSAVDIGFCQDMVVHHAQAVVMAQDALGNGSSPAVRTLARQILIGQSQERGTMSGWLIDWDAPALPNGPPMTWMSAEAMAGMRHGSTTMPGMASQAELDRLGRLHGKRFDVLFLQLMLRHHIGGIIMALDAQQHASLLEVRSLAGAIVLDQTQENAIITGLLEDDGAKPLPTN